MNKKRALMASVAIVVTYYTARQVFKNLADWRRIDRIRAMSNEKPFSAELPSLLAKAMNSERDFGPELIDFALSAPKEFLHYVEMGAM